MIGTELRSRRAGALVFAIVLAGCSSRRDVFGEDPSPGFNDDAAAPSPDGAPPACDAVTLEAQHRPLDLFLTLDKSGSMVGQPWRMAVSSLKEFFANPESGDISAALNYFPSIGCVRDNYSSFDVGLSPLPGHAAMLGESLDRTTPTGGTPLHPALDGALLTATQQKRAQPDHQVAVVLVSDGAPTDCLQGGDEELLRLAHIALVEYGTLTFTIGIGAPAQLMNAIAAAGGTEHALSVNSAAEIGKGLREAQVQALGCELLFPKTAPDGRPTRPDLVNVIITDEQGPRTIRGAERADACGNREGWYYDDPKNPNVLHLCPASCSLVKERAGSKANVQIGCATWGPR